jgi:hypothetical protein
MEQGYISIFRSIKSHWIWDDPIKLKWWIDILLSVNYKDNVVNIGYELYDCKRGQSIKSLSTWASDWKVSKDTVRNFFKLLQKDDMISLENMTKTTRITVLYYDTYQLNLHDKQTVSKRQANDKQTQSDPNNKDNKDNKENKNTLLFEIEISNVPQIEKRYYEIAISFYRLFEKNLTDVNLPLTNIKKIKYSDAISEIRKIMEIDKYTDQHLRDAFKFLIETDFWKKNISSFGKLRKQMETLLKQANYGEKQGIGNNQGASIDGIAEIINRKFAKDN